MAHVPLQHEAHVIVAAVRVLVHKTGRPPSVDEVADLLGYARELTGHLVRGLETAGVVQTIKSPFDLRVEVQNHLAIESLPAEATGPGLRDEVEEFHERFKEKQEKLQNLFDSGAAEAQRKSRLAGLDNELQSFQKPRRNPFGDPPEESS